ncbi:asparagine synthase C-terminal domain-containing protein [Haloparvum sp. PAK95]|uniref:asparagine synthase C-terminal domain-containing protein n=1 Tax=Haloparvum sp. PAK95 TaxID=3418962 RepID=UPI003D2EA228
MTRLRGASPDAVREALATATPLSGSDGFAGLLRNPPTADGPALVRDVLGREPLFVEADQAESLAAPESATDDDEGEDEYENGNGAWSFDPTDLDDPRSVPAGAVLTRTGGRQALALPDPPAAEPTDAMDAVESALTEATTAVGANADADGLAVAFSGGVDSALVAGGVPDAPCYVAGFEGCHDVAAARDAAAEMDRDLRVVEITHEDLRRAVPELVAATGRRNPMDLNIALPLYLTAEAVAADGYDRLALGQGADELFGGYSKVVEPEDDDRVAAETVRGARTETVRTLPDQLERDVLALRAAGVEPVTPLLADVVVDAALRLPEGLLATPGERKIALRRAAAGDVPESVRTADKKAVQYGTYVSRELDRLARQAGFKRRMDDHVGQYVDALVAGDV